MSRIRTIKPEAFESLSLGRVPVPARWLFAGLWTMADDEGRLQDSPILIRSKLFPVDDLPLSDVEDWLKSLIGEGHLCRYTAPDGTPLLHIPNFPVHQVINRPSKSRLPPCPTPHAAPEPAPRPGRPRKLATAVDPGPEPPRKCEKHANSRESPACGSCKEHRIQHEAWQVATAARRAQEAEMAANTLCGSVTCGCDHEKCDYGWITMETTYRGKPTEVQAKCPACWPRPEPSTNSERKGPPFVDARELGADYPDHAAAAAGDR